MYARHAVNTQLIKLSGPDMNPGENTSLIITLHTYTQAGLCFWLCPSVITHKILSIYNTIEISISKHIVDADICHMLVLV